MAFLPLPASEHDDGATTLSVEEPWPGLAAFREEDAAFFAARSEERDQLLGRVLRYRLTVLHGLSGLGKTSLLQAGLFPALRERQFLPVPLRLTFIAEAPPLTEQVFAAIQAAAAAADATPPVRRAGETLWEYFHREGNELWTRRNRLLTPLLVFDQFEEIFSLGVHRRPVESREFVDALADLSEGRAPRAVKERLDSASPEAARNFAFNRRGCHVLLALREDYLAQLDDLRALMPTVAHNRMRLRPFNALQAAEVVLQPGGKLVTPEVAREIVKAVAAERQRSRPTEEQEIDPALLCLLCRELNKRRIAEQQAQITADLLTDQAREQILTAFYETAMAQVSNVTRRWVEEELLLGSGLRDSAAIESAVQAGVSEAEIDELIAERVLRKEERGGVVRVELTHDVLTEVVQRSRDARRQREAGEAAEREREHRAAEERRKLEEETRRQGEATKRQRKLTRIAGSFAVVFLVCLPSRATRSGRRPWSVTGPRTRDRKRRRATSLAARCLRRTSIR